MKLSRCGRHRACSRQYVLSRRARTCQEMTSLKANLRVNRPNEASVHCLMALYDSQSQTISFLYVLYHLLKICDSLLTRALRTTAACA